MFETIKKIHMVGIGGSGMCGIAEVLLNLGYEVSGSDISESSKVKYLKKLGAEIYIGHSRENLNSPHVVVISSAIDESNSEVRSATEKNIPVIPRAEMLCELMRLKYALCVAGTHGKTTTTSMLGLILSEASLDPTVVVGGLFKNLKSNAKPGRGQFMVAEADESDGSFLKLTPTIALVTNIDDDHMDYYGSIKNLKNTFVRFLNKVPFYGFSVVCGDNKNIQGILSKITRPYITYGLGGKNICRAEEKCLCDEKSSYLFYKKDRRLGEITVHASGMHNVLNSLGAASVALEMGIDFKVIQKALYKYQGVSRRLERKEEKAGIIFYDDYAHHPREIKLALESLKSIYPSRRLVAVFQPHRYSRTKKLAHSFPSAFKNAQQVYITGIYAAGEKPIDGVRASIISEAFKNPEKVTYIEDKTELKNTLRAELRPGDLCITLGAGDIYKIGEEVIEETPE